MRRVLRGFAVGLLIGGLLGLWFGMNIGKGQPLLSNPFARVQLSHQIDRAADGVTDAAGEAANKAGDTVEQAADKAGDAISDNDE